MFIVSALPILLNGSIITTVFFLVFAFTMLFKIIRG